MYSLDRCICSVHTNGGGFNPVEFGFRFGWHSVCRCGFLCSGVSRWQIQEPSDSVSSLFVVVKSLLTTRLYKIRVRREAISTSDRTCSLEAVLSTFVCVDSARSDREIGSFDCGSVAGFISGRVSANPKQYQ